MRFAYQKVVWTGHWLVISDGSLDEGLIEFCVHNTLGDEISMTFWIRTVFKFA